MFFFCLFFTYLKTDYYIVLVNKIDLFSEFLYPKEGKLFQQLNLFTLFIS